MRKDDLLKYISTNSESIHFNLKNVFNINNDDFNTLIENLKRAFYFNKQLNSKEYSIFIFSIDNLSNLKNVLKDHSISEDIISKILIKSPIIILYSDNIDCIYYLFKNNKYYGYTILDDGKYNTYLLNNNLRSNIISNNYPVNIMTSFYNYKLLDNFSSLESNKNKIKNYYFKEKKGK